MLLPVAFVLLQAVPRLKLWAAPIGFVIMCLSLSLSSFATTTAHLIVSQGVAYGIGASLAYAPTIVFMDDWFVQRKGLAFGIMWVSDHSMNLNAVKKKNQISNWFLGRYWTIWSHSSHRPSMDAELLRAPDNTTCLVSRADGPRRPTAVLPSPPAAHFTELAIQTFRLQVPLGVYVPYLRNGEHPGGHGLLPPYHLPALLRP